ELGFLFYKQNGDYFEPGRVIYDLSGLTTGATYYLGAGGTLSETPASTEIVIGQAISTTSLFFYPKRAEGGAGVTAYTQTVLAEENGPLATSTNGGFQWSFGNGAETPQPQGMPVLFGGAITKLALETDGAGTVEVYLNGTATGITITEPESVKTVNIPVSEGDVINFRTTATTTPGSSSRVIAFLERGTPPVGAPVNTARAPDGQEAYWNASAAEIQFRDAVSGGASTSKVRAIAAGSTLGLQQKLLANAGQPGLTVLAVGFTNTGKVQGVSLGAGNVVEVYASGADFNSGTLLYREFMNFGEPICFTGLTNGAIITSSQGFYGFSEQLIGGNESPMPLLSYGLSFNFTFFFGFRNSTSLSGTSNQGTIRVVNGPLENTVRLTFGNGNVVNGQENITLQPWEFTSLQTEGNVEYILEGTNPMMACVHAYTNIAGDGGSRFYDSRLLMPLTNDGITWPRSGFVSAPYNNTIVNWWTRDGVTGSLNDGNGVSPGSPIDFDQAPPIGTGASDQDYEPNGATRVKAIGLISAYSGADSAGLEASPLMPTSAMSQVVAQPLFIEDSGDGGNSGVAIASPYEGTARIYSYNTTTGQLDLEYTVPVTRSGVTVVTQDDQNHPAAGMVANDSVDGVVVLEGQLNPGVVIADVPITVVVQNANPNLAPSIRSQNGSTTTSIVNDDDETLSMGITPNTIAVEIREDANGLFRRRTLDSSGVETWPLA
ncbi:MAG: hypothetical protein AAF267_21570, partial [Deinococcota bacterium]